MTVLCCGLKHNKTLKIINLDENNLSVNGLTTLFNTLSSDDSNVSVLSLSGK